MNFEQSMDFVQMLLEKLHISSCIIEDSEACIPSEVDKGLRAMLFGESNYAKLLINSPKEAKSNVIYRFYDEYLCNYIFFLYFDSDFRTFLHLFLHYII